MLRDNCLKSSFYWTCIFFKLDTLRDNCIQTTLKMDTSKDELSSFVPHYVKQKNDNKRICVAKNSMKARQNSIGFIVSFCL